MPIASTQTNAQGVYILPGLPPGGYTVQFSFPNYQTAIEDVIIERDSTTTFDLALEPFPNALNSVKKCQLKVVYLTQKETKNRIQWTSSSPGIVAYRIYRNHVLIGQVPGNILFYEDHNIRKNRSYSYQVSAVNSFGLEGPLVEAIPSKGSKCTCGS